MQIYFLNLVLLIEYIYVLKLISHRYKIPSILLQYFMVHDHVEKLFNFTDV